MSVWVCGACGKWARDRMKLRDVSCVINAVECHDNERTEGKEYGSQVEGWVAVPPESTQG